MTDKTMNQIEQMKKQTIGVEIEMNNITREKAARLAAEYFGTGRYEYTARRNGYETWSAWDASGKCRRTSAFTEPTARNANWLPRS